MFAFAAILILLIGLKPDEIKTNILHPVSTGYGLPVNALQLSERGCFWIDMKFIDLTGKRYGMLVVQNKAAILDKIQRRIIWECMCDCGNKKRVCGENLRYGDTKSCGCYSKDHPARLKHGCAIAGKEALEYRIWCAMRQRCLNPKVKCYKNYGGRGIRVCERWMEFKNFLADMGARPSKKHSIERKNNNGDYEPDNCRWATPQEQGRNTRFNHVVEFNGKKQVLTDWSLETGISQATLRNRLKKWSVADALTRPIRGQNKC